MYHTIRGHPNVYYTCCELADVSAASNERSPDPALTSNGCGCGVSPSGVTWNKYTGHLVLDIRTNLL